MMLLLRLFNYHMMKVMLDFKITHTHTHTHTHTYIYIYIYIYSMVNVFGTVTMKQAGKQRNSGSYLGRCKRIVFFSKQTISYLGPA
jgi:Ni/Fe-hydrogenase subunit HybB-like protein